MAESTGSWKRFCDKVNKRTLANSLVALMVILFVGSFPGVLSPPFSKICMLFAEIILAILIVWAAVAFQGQGSYIVDRYPAEFDRLAIDFEKTANEAILKMLGKEAYLKLYPEDFHWASAEGRLLEISKRSEVAKDELHFYMLAKKANVEALNDNYAKAEECLREALSLEPNFLILWLRLAEVCERLGSGPEAVAAYEGALALAPENPKIKEHLRAQIQLVRTQGPRKQLPLQGFRYASV